MRTTVHSGFNSFTKTFEGRVPWMYLDIKALVTVAVGNLIDPIDAALALPFIHKSDQVSATTDEIRTEWTMLKSKPELAQQGYKACEAITSLRMTEQAMDALVLDRLQKNETFLRTSFPSWDDWPADAQLGVLSMAWALGAGFASKWPKFSAAAKAGEWTTAAANCKIDETGNPGVKSRNVADAKLFTNAAAVVAGNLDPEVLHYPGDATSSTPAGSTQSSETPNDGSPTEDSSGGSPAIDGSSSGGPSTDTTVSEDPRDTPATSLTDTGSPADTGPVDAGAPGGTGSGDGASASPDAPTGSPATGDASTGETTPTTGDVPTGETTPTTGDVPTGETAPATDPPATTPELAGAAG
jgi:GH24 family phage-related lysozyme (muramidase)